MSTVLEYAYIKWALQLIKCFNFASTFNQQQKLIIALCHRIKFVSVERFLHWSYLLLQLLCRSYSVLSHSSQCSLDIRACFIERGNVSIITLLTVFHYCLSVSCKMSHATVLINLPLAFRNKPEATAKITIGICFKQKTFQNTNNCILFWGF